MSETLITLPSQDILLERLCSVNDQSHLQEHFYPLLAEHAGTELMAEGVVIMLLLAISDYTEGLPPLLKKLILMEADEYIDALVVDYQSVATEAKAFLRETLNQSSSMTSA